MLSEPMPKPVTKRPAENVCQARRFESQQASALTCKNRVRVERRGLYDDANTEDNRGYPIGIMESEAPTQVNVSVPARTSEEIDIPRTIVYLRESLSARYPEQSTPNHAPSSRMATNQPFLPVSFTTDAIRWSNEYMPSTPENTPCTEQHNVVSVPKFQRTALRSWDRLSHVRTWLYPVSHCTR